MNNPKDLKVDIYKLLKGHGLEFQYNHKIDSIDVHCLAEGILYLTKEAITQARQYERTQLNLQWGQHTRKGEEHTEYYAPCGCAFHPEPYPHVHACSDEHDRGRKRVEGLMKTLRDIETDVYSMHDSTISRWAKQVIKDYEDGK